MSNVVENLFKQGYTLEDITKEYARLTKEQDEADQVAKKQAKAADAVNRTFAAYLDTIDFKDDKTKEAYISSMKKYLELIPKVKLSFLDFKSSDNFDDVFRKWERWF